IGGNGVAGSATLTVQGTLDGQSHTFTSDPIDILDGQGFFRGQLGLVTGDSFEITSVQLVVAGGPTLAPGLSKPSGSDDDSGDDDGEDDHSVARDHGGDDGEDEDGDGGGYSTPLIAAFGVTNPAFDSAGGAHVRISDLGLVQASAHGVTDSGNPFTGTCSLNVDFSGSVAGAFLS